MILTKQNLSVLAGVAKDQENIYALDHVMIDTNRGFIYGSDGHCLFKSKLDADLLDEDFPDCGVKDSGVVSPILIKGEDLSKTEKSVPKKQSMPILENMQVVACETHYHIITTDLDATRIAKTKPPGSRFPEVEKIEKTVCDEANFKTIVSVSNLEKLVKALKKNGCEEVLIEGRDAQLPVVAKTIDGVFTAYIMPMDMDGVYCDNE